MPRPPKKLKLRFFMNLHLLFMKNDRPIFGSVILNAEYQPIETLLEILNTTFVHEKTHLEYFQINSYSLLFTFLNMEAILSGLHSGSFESRFSSSEIISVSDFLQETWDDYNSPTTSNFVQHIGRYRSTTAVLEEVGRTFGVLPYYFC